MITFDKGTITEQQLRDITKNYIGIRYRTHKNGTFEAYLNAFTVFADLWKNL